MEIKKVRREGRLKKVTIPITSEIKVGDYVKIILVRNEDSEDVRI